MKKFILTLSILSCFNAVADSSGPNVWQDFGQNVKNISNQLHGKDTIKQRRLLLDESLLKNYLSSSINSSVTRGIAAKSVGLVSSSFEINLPLPNGTSVRVKASPSSVMTAAMAEAYPELKTWKVVGLDDPDISGVIDFTSNGFHGMLMMPDGDTVYIDPDKYHARDVYNSFSKRENADAFDVELNCGVHEDHDHNAHKEDTDSKETEFAIKTAARALSSSSFPDVSIADVKTYRLALSATAEYTASQGTTAGARSAMVTSINRINPVFIRDLGVELQLIDDPSLIFTDIDNDPFSNPNNPSTLMIENGDYLSNQNKLDQFDIGHVLSKTSNGFGGSGVAFLGVACLDEARDGNGNIIGGIKAAGATASSSPNGESFDLVLLAHELGHQLGANHSFNSSLGGNCGSGRSGAVAVEPGSGSSVMAYSGLCFSDNLNENPRDDYFHFASISQINRYTRSGRGATCGGTPEGGSIAAVDAGADINIPANTPFLLDGTASGGISSWDQIDIGSASSVDVDNGESAIIRHLIPTSEQDRYIPSLANLFAGTSTKGEIVPTTTRELNFAYVVRNGGVASDKKLINVTDTNSIFSVVSQSSGQTFTTNQNIQVTWNLADTNQAPINCNNVDIQLIRQNGVKNMLLASTPNDGTQSLVVSNATPVLSGARVFVGCSDNSFFNISSGSITVQKVTTSADTTAPVITLNGASTLNIEQGTNYTDAGATATDNLDGSILVSQRGSVEINTVGVYIISYTAVDSAGNAASATRRVNVIAPPVVTPDTSAPLISLIGTSEVSVKRGSSYNESGASAFDEVDGNVIVVISGTVNTNLIGTYTITYKATDTAGNSSISSRIVVVTDIPDTIAPVISLMGEPEITLQVGDVFVDPGFAANDDRDGSTTVKITGLDEIDTSKAGEYVITYTSVDAAGNTVTSQRTIVVMGDNGQASGPSPESDISNSLSGDSDNSSGGGSFGYLIMSLMILLGLRRASKS